MFAISANAVLVCGRERHPETAFLEVSKQQRHTV